MRRWCFGCYNVLMVAAAVPIPEARIAEICRRYDVGRLELFGSVLRDDFRPGRSDIDMLVDFLPGRAIGFFELAKLEDELSALFPGRVDLVTRRSLSRWIRKRVLDEARVIYVAQG